MIKQGKFWGSTSKIWSGNNSEVHRINILEGGYCSKHKHIHKYNLFYIEKGSLKIDVWKDDNIIDTTILQPEETSIVEPGLFHRFTALQDTVALEIYWVELKEDIIRVDHGGIYDS